MTNNSSETEHTLDCEPAYLDNDFMHKSSVYKEFLAERNEILKHKWIESEKVGYDIGKDRAKWSWITTHKNTWHSHWIKKNLDDLKNKTE